MNKSRLVPIHFKSGKDEDFESQLGILKELLFEEVDVLEPVVLGESLPEADGVVFPQLLGDAYSQVEALQLIQLPKLVITSEFGTVSMWDWEIIDYMRSKGVELLSAPSLDETKILCRALSLKRELKKAYFMVYQDNPGEGFQAPIFKRFYWWEDECTQRIFGKFGIQIIKKSYRDLASRACSITDEQAKEAFEKRKVNAVGLSERAILSAVKQYLVLKQELQHYPKVVGVGINCLNESHFSDTTPCLAWNWLFEEQELIWGCEADTVSMLTQYLLNKSLGAPVMMTNLYPFEMGEAATKHEHIPGFPEVPNPEGYILAAHCGYLGVVPASFSTQWALKPNVLSIVDDNASAIDARLPEGDITLVKLNAGMDKFSVAEAILEKYVQFPNSHCLNGAMIKVARARNLIDRLISHHYIVVSGHHNASLHKLSKVWDVAIEEI